MQPRNDIIVPILIGNVTGHFGHFDHVENLVVLFPRAHVGLIRCSTFPPYNADISCSRLTIPPAWNLSTLHESRLEQDRKGSTKDSRSDKIRGPERFTFWN